jgi:aspartate beta-hydroxylase
MSGQLRTLVAAAGAAASAGRWPEAERLWAQVRTIDPGNVQALFSLGVHAYRRGDHASALEFLTAAQAGAPGDPMIRLSIATVHRETGNANLEWASLM